MQSTLTTGPKIRDHLCLFVDRPVDAVRLRIVDTEIQMSGDHVNTGYLDPARNAETKV